MHRYRERRYLRREELMPLAEAAAQANFRALLVYVVRDHGTIVAEGGQALRAAAHEGRDLVVDLLLQNGVDADQPSGTDGVRWRRPTTPARRSDFGI